MSNSVDCPDCGGTGRVGEGLLDPARLSILRDSLIDAGCPEETCRRCKGKKRVLMADGYELRRQRDKHIFVMLPPQKLADCPDCGATGRVPNPLLAHLADVGPHVPGCWVLSLLLGKD